MLINIAIDVISIFVKKLIAKTNLSNEGACKAGNTSLCCRS